MTVCNIKDTHMYIYPARTDSACATFYVLHSFAEVVCFFPPIYIPLITPKIMKELSLVVFLLLKCCEAFPTPLSSQNALGVGCAVKLGVIFKFSAAFHLLTPLQSGFPQWNISVTWTICQKKWEAERKKENNKEHCSFLQTFIGWATNQHPFCFA